MAKWGEGDPRWIVEERPDAINVNNWHWTERNACGWSQNKFKQLFRDLKIVTSEFNFKITEVDKCEGDAVANNRKGKLIFFYEWDLTLKWEGQMKDDESVKATGKINIPNLSEENTVNEIDINVSVNENTPHADDMKNKLRSVGDEIIRGQLSKYIQGLKAEFSQGMILPSKGNDSTNKMKDSINNLTTGLEKKVQMENANANTNTNLNVNTNPNTDANTNSNSNDPVDDKNVGNKKDREIQFLPQNIKWLSTIKMTQKFQCTGPELYNVLTNADMVAAFTHGPVKIDLRQGGEFELFGGNIHGVFIELVPDTKIVQTWRFKRWPEGHYSTVSMDIMQQSDHTELKLGQSCVPSGEVEATKENWEGYYWDAIKRTFGFGYFI